MKINNANTFATVDIPLAHLITRLPNMLMASSTATKMRNVNVFTLKISVSCAQACWGKAVASSVETNIVVIRLREGGRDAAAVAEIAAAGGVAALAFAERTVRAVTHLDVSREDCERAADVVADAIAG